MAHFSLHGGIKDHKTHEQQINIFQVISMHITHENICDYFLLQFYPLHELLQVRTNI